MTIFVRIFGSTADTDVSPIGQTTYAAARALTSATTTNNISGGVGQRFVTPNYTCNQTFLQFDTTTAPTSGSVIVSVNVTQIALTFTDTGEVSEVSSSTNKIAGASLGSLTQIGSIASPTATGRISIPLTGRPSVSSAVKLLMSGRNERLNTTPTSREDFFVNLADITGTTNDPFLDFIGGAGWDFIAAGTSVESAATSHVLIEPAGVASGDLLVACIGSRIASTTAITLPSGWTRVNQALNNNILTTSSALPSGMMAYILRGSSAPSYTFTHPTAPSVALGRVFAYRNVHQTTPLDTGTTAVTTATALLSISVTGLTTTADDELIVALAAGGQEAAWSAFGATDPATGSGTTADSTLDPIWGQWLERSDIQTTTGSDTSLAVFDAVKQTAGATGNLIATASVSAGHVVVAGSFKLAPSGPPPSTGTLATTFDAATLAGTGTVTTPALTGTLAATLDAATLAGTAGLLVAGTASNTLGTLTALGSAKAIATGTLAQTLDPLTLAAAGTVRNQVFTGTLSATLDALTASATGQVPSQGTSAVTLGAATLAATGTVTARGTFAATLDAVALAGSGTGIAGAASGTLSATLGAATLLGTGTVVNQIFSGTLGVTLGTLTLAGSGKVPAQGTLAATLAPLGLLAAGAVPVGGTVTATLGALALAGTGAVTTPARTGTLNVTLNSAILVASSQPVAVGGLAAALAPATLLGTGTVGRVGTLAATLAPGTLVGTGTVVNQVFSATLSVTLAPLTLTGAAAVAARGTLARALDGLALDASGRVAARGTLSTVLGGLVLDGAAHTTAIAQGTLAATLGDVQLVAKAGEPKGAPRRIVLVGRSDTTLPLAAALDATVAFKGIMARTVGLRGTQAQATSLRGTMPVIIQLGEAAHGRQLLDVRGRHQGAASHRVQQRDHVAG